MHNRVISFEFVLNFANDLRLLTFVENLQLTGIRNKELKSTRLLRLLVLADRIKKLNHLTKKTLNLLLTILVLLFQKSIIYRSISLFSG